MIDEIARLLHVHPLEITPSHYALTFNNLQRDDTFNKQSILPRNCFGALLQWNWLDMKL